jgi:chromosomal replication initiation ATPase DnaA
VIEQPPPCANCAALAARIVVLEDYCLSSAQGSGGTITDAVLENVGSVFGFTKGDLLRTARNSEVIEARFAAYWIFRRVTDWSLPRIARAMKRLDHTTIMNGILRAENLREVSTEYLHKTNLVMNLMDEWNASKMAPII